MILQLAIIYMWTGCAKTGSVWAKGYSLYYALNLDHFARVPTQVLPGFEPDPSIPAEAIVRGGARGQRPRPGPGSGGTHQPGRPRGRPGSGRRRRRQG